MKSRQREVVFESGHDSQTQNWREIYIFAPIIFISSVTFISFRLSHSTSLEEKVFHHARSQVSLGGDFRVAKKVCFERFRGCNLVQSRRFLWPSRSADLSLRASSSAQNQPLVYQKASNTAKNKIASPCFSIC